MHNVTYITLQYCSAIHTYQYPGDLISSIFKIIFTSWVARLICCFIASSVSITCWVRMSGGGGGGEGREEGGWKCDVTHTKSMFHVHTHVTDLQISALAEMLS